MQLTSLLQYLSIFTTFLHFSESATQDRISRHYRELRKLYKILFLFIYDIIM